jgi:3-dehydroquinate synthase
VVRVAARRSRPIASAASGAGSAALADPTVFVAAGQLDSVGDRTKAAAPAHRYVIITDDVVEPLYADRVAASFGGAPVDLLSVPAGEATKTRETWSLLTDALIARRCGRDTTIVALGGGTVGDLAGFVAATFMRGVPIVQVPTTLLAMIDASIGGKTGVDTPAGKNLVGAFHPASAVIVDPDVLDTLPTRHLRAGLAEALKHGVIADGRYFARVVDDLPLLMSAGGARQSAMLALVLGSIAIKSAVVAADAREMGRRKILNFGHTIGHAVEIESGYTLLHGEAVAIGMAVEARLAELAGVCGNGLAAELRSVLERAALPTTPPASMAPEDIVALTHHDKKVRAGSVEYALPRRFGEMAAADAGWAVPLSDELVMRALR